MTAPPQWAFLIPATSVIRGLWLSRRIRVRQWGRLPLWRDATVMIANHQYEDESEIIVERQYLQGPWHKPPHSLGSRRMFEPGFFALRLPHTKAFTRTLNVGPLLRGLGFYPIENQLATRPLISLADAVRAVHGDIELSTVFADNALATVTGARVLSDLWHSAHFTAAQEPVKLTRLREPYRGETLALTRTTFDRDVADIVAAVRSGATFYITAEGFYSTDGRMTRLKGILRHVTPIADPWLAAIAFDVFRPGRLSMLYRIVRPLVPADLDASLAAARPLTASAVVAAFIVAQSSSFRADDAVAAVTATIAALPSTAFVDPEFATDLKQSTRDILAALVVRGALRRNGDVYDRGEPPTDKNFPLVTDMLAYQANFGNETIAAAVRVAKLHAGV